MKLKVCGMKYNPEAVAKLQPDYLGFIFWEPSSRYFEGEIPELPLGIKKIGVFVDATLDHVLEHIKKYDLDGVQLHGKESSNYCQNLKESFLSFRAESRRNKNNDGTPKQVPDENLIVIKVFSIKNEFDFSILDEYEDVCDYYLFDTKGELPGGNGFTFDWSVLKNYPSTKPYFLSGGIGLESSDQLQDFFKSSESKYCHAIDVNSKFEEKPGLKDIKKLEKFADNLKEPS